MIIPDHAKWRDYGTTRFFCARELLHQGSNYSRGRNWTPSFFSDPARPHQKEKNMASERSARVNLVSDCTGEEGVPKTYIRKYTHIYCQQNLQRAKLAGEEFCLNGSTLQRNWMSHTDRRAPRLLRRLVRRVLSWVEKLNRCYLFFNTIQFSWTAQVLSLYLAIILNLKVPAKLNLIYRFLAFDFRGCRRCLLGGNNWSK